MFYLWYRIKLIIDPEAADEALPIADATLMTAEVVIGAPLALLPALNAGRIGRANDGGTLPRTKPATKSKPNITAAAVAQ